MNLEDTIVWLKSRHEKGLRLDRVFLEHLKMDSRTFMERQLSIEVLKSEKLRSGILMAVGILTLLWMLFIQLFDPDSLPVIKSKIVWGVTFGNWLVIVSAALALYEYALTRLFDYFLREGLEQPVMPRYFNAVVEVSIPTFVMFLASQAVESYQALFSPMEFLYFIFIILSILRMKFPWVSSPEASPVWSTCSWPGLFFQNRRMPPTILCSPLAYTWRRACCLS